MEKLIADISEKEIRTYGFYPNKLAKMADGVMLRLGWAGYNGEIGFDDKIEENIKAAADAGLHIGLYLYCYCKTPAAANLAAKNTVDFVQRFKEYIDMPIAIMVCETHLPCLVEQGREGLTDTVNAFLFEAQQLGYYAMFATYTAFAVTYLNMERLKSRDIWIIDYRMDEKIMRRQLGRNDYGMWRCENGLSRCYKNYPEITAEFHKKALLTL